MIATPGWVRFWMENYSGVIFFALKFWYSPKKQYLCSRKRVKECSSAWEATQLLHLITLFVLYYKGIHKRVFQFFLHDISKQRFLLCRRFRKQRSEESHLLAFSSCSSGGSCLYDHRKIGILGIRDAGIPRYRNTEIPRYRDTEDP